ncbi:MAG: MFS transporter [Solobacterium sp.]|nr:MFS transporter [Solobacterium sp.]
MKQGKIFYGWVIVGAGCVIMAAAMGIVSNCNSLFIKPVSEDLGLSRQSVSMMLSLMSFGSMAASFCAGKIFNETNIVKVMKVSITVMCIAYFLNSTANNIYVLYATHLINGITMCLVTTLPMTFLINNWFRDKVGYALGLASMGSGFGGAIFNSLAGQLMTRLGWRGTYRVLFLFLAVTAVPCVFFLLKLKPEDMGLTPYTENKETVTEVQGEVSGYSFAEVRRMPLFWIICVMAVVIGTCMNGMYTSISPHLQDRGYSLAFSANFLSVCMFVMALCKILLGRIFDRAGVRLAFCWACLTLVFAMTGLLFCRVMPALLLVIIGVGFGCVFGAVVFPLSIPLVFGKKDYRLIMGPLGALISLGGVVGPTLAGKVYDMTGTYQMFYLVSLFIMAAVVLIMFRILPKKEDQFS